MLVESETCPCDKAVPEWFYRVFIGTTYPHRSIFLTLSNLEEQQVMEGTNSGSFRTFRSLQPKQGVACLYEQSQLLESIGMCNLVKL